MKRSIGAMLLAAVATSGKWLSGSPVLSSPGYARFRPTGAALRDPSHPAQAATIKAAVAKRDHRALMRHVNTRTSVAYNRTTFSWKGPFPDLVCRNNLNPFYIAK